MVILKNCFHSYGGTANLAGIKSELVQSSQSSESDPFNQATHTENAKKIPVRNISSALDLHEVNYCQNSCNCPV